MSSHTDNAITAAQIERDRLCEECFQMLYKISRKASCLNLLGLALAHLKILAEYKANRSRLR